MLRTTIVLPPALKQRAVDRSHQDGVSFGEFVRRAVETQLAASPKSTAGKTADPFGDNLTAYDDKGPVDLAERHDDYLYGRSS
jgi:hypothetical protein